MRGVTIDGGKMYDDILAGQCAQGSWTCYMTMTASMVSSGPNTLDPTLYDEVQRSVDRWNQTDTTLYYSLIADNGANDLRFKEYDLPYPALSQTVVANFHGVQCPTANFIAFDCEDTNENPPPSSHQPERWWYSYIRLDPEFTYYSGNKDGVVAHEMGHAVGLAHYPTPESGSDGVCASPHQSIMDDDCASGPRYVQPKPVDQCAHAVSPLMYGDGGPTSDPAQDPHAYHQCP